jgi:hypothetical protein
MALSQASLWWTRWRLFFLSVDELFGHSGRPAVVGEPLPVRTPLMLQLAFLGLLAGAGLALPAWAISLRLRDASIADRIWPLLVALPVLSYAYALPSSARSLWMIALLLGGPSAWPCTSHAATGATARTAATEPCASATSRISA